MYKLRGELRAHQADVRGVAVSPEGVVATASRDKTAIVWSIDTLEPKQVLRGHSHFVNDLLFLDATTLVTASGDHTLRVWNITTGECIATLIGHTGPVCAVAKLPTAPNAIISSSWDKTARVWDVSSAKCVRSLAAHTAAVWSAAGLADGRIVTVAADKSIRVWDAVADHSIVLPSAHTDVVRDVIPIPKGAFTTVANDSSLVVWCDAGSNFEVAHRLEELHDGQYVYAVDAAPVGSNMTDILFASGGEDNALRLATGTHSCADLSSGQVIMHPGTVWKVCIGPGDHVVTGCSDGVARIFTKDPAEYAEAEVLAAFDKAVSERQLNTKVIGGVDVAKLPTSEALQAPGKKDGENKIVRTKDGKAEVHMWSAAEQSWSKVGDVVDGPGGGATMGGGSVGGKKYDFVFEVEIGEGGKKESLGYNRGENPYLAAQRFIDDNELSQEFLDQIAQFVEQQVPPDALQSGGGAPSDPLTGGSRYVPGGSSGPSAAQGGDPLTGGSRYVPGGGTNAAPGGLPPPRKLIPHANGMISYSSSDQIDKITSKLAEMNAGLARQESPLALSMEQAKVFGQSLMPKLKSRGGGTVVDDEDCAVLEKMMKWPTADVFAVLDVARLVIALPTGGTYFFGKRNGEILSDVLEHMASSAATGAVHIMGCRFLCNLFGNRVVGAAVRAQCEQILRAASGAGRSSNRRARETFASLLINYAVMLYEAKAETEAKGVVLSRAVEMVTSGEKDEEVLYRVMVAMGTLMCDDNAAAKHGLELGVAKAAADVAPVSARLQQVSLEIATIIAR